MFPGRRFHNPPMRAGNSGLGDLPATFLQERGEYQPLNDPVGIPPMGNALAPGANPGSMQSVSDKQSQWQFIPFIVGVTPIKLQDSLARKFMLLQNQDAVGSLLFGFGWIPTPKNGLILGPGQGYEPFTYPTNEIYVVGSQADVTGLFIFGN